MKSMNILLLCGALVYTTSAIAQGNLIFDDKESLGSCSNLAPLHTSDSGTNAWGVPNTGGTSLDVYIEGACSTLRASTGAQWSSGSYTLNDNTTYHFCADSISNVAQAYCSGGGDVITGIIIYTTVGGRRVISDCFPISGCDASCSSCIYSGTGQNYVMQ